MRTLESMFVGGCELSSHWASRIFDDDDDDGGGGDDDGGGGGDDDQDIPRPIETPTPLDP